MAIAFFAIVFAMTAITLYRLFCFRRESRALDAEARGVIPVISVQPGINWKSNAEAALKAARAGLGVHLTHLGCTTEYHDCNCGRLNHRHAKYCGDCGRPLFTEYPKFDFSTLDLDAIIDRRGLPRLA
jgi:hypothetical protein